LARLIAKNVSAEISKELQEISKELQKGFTELKSSIESLRDEVLVMNRGRVALTSSSLSGQSIKDVYFFSE